MILKVLGVHCGSFACVWKGFLGGSDSKQSACNAEDPGFDPQIGKIPLEKEMTTYSSILA